MLRLTGALAGMAAAAQFTPAPATAAPRYSDNPFTLGVASGEPLPDGVVLWTRLAPVPLAEDGLGGMPPSDVAVRWEVAEDPGMRRVVRRGSAAAKRDFAHSVHVEVTGLRPGREYWYRFRSGGELSAVGRTKTAPPAGSLTPMTLAFATCQSWSDGFYTAYRHLADQDLDLVAHLGDYIYEYPVSRTSGPRGTDLSAAHNAETLTLDQYRLRYALYRTDPDLQAAHAAAPWIATVDDHDVEDNWAGETSFSGASPEDLLRRRAAAFRAYYEHLPLRASALPQGPDMRLHRTLDYGRLARFHVLDARQFRDPIDITRRDDPARSMLGAAQERWLLDGLADSAATWNVLTQQVLMMQLDRLTDPGLQQLNGDAWDGYTATRARLLDGIAERRVANPVVLTGDMHVNMAGTVTRDFADPSSPAVAPEFVTTSITSGGNGADSSPQAEEWLAANPHLAFYNGQRGYVRCTVSPGEWRADYLVVDRVSVPDGSVSTRRSFVVEAGRPDLQEA